MAALHVDEQALARLYAPWEEPNQHRESREIVSGRRPSPLAVPNALRQHVKVWRDTDYEGASETSRLLLTHWFGGEHLLDSRIGGHEFRYYFCQREAIETLVYLYEVERVRSVSDLITAAGGAVSNRAYGKGEPVGMDSNRAYGDGVPVDMVSNRAYGKGEPVGALSKRAYGNINSEILAAGVPPSENAWPKYAFKLATGTGKTKCMSLAIVWSYFHALREPDSEMTMRFLVIAPGLTVYERLLEDFGGGKIFDTDPLIPPAWKSDWHLNVIQGNEPGGASNGVLYLTNIHKLYPKRQTKRAGRFHAFMGPAVTPTRALDIGAALRERIANESRIMILNDEAHHVWHPELAWPRAIEHFHQEGERRHGNGLVAQLDFSATPRDQSGTPLLHIVCDTPLGEAVDAGIVKVPIIGRANLQEAPSDNAAERYREHLVTGYKRWQRSCAEWEEVGKKALLFVMCESTNAADEIAKVLNTDAQFAELNGKTLNLHTNLKGKINRRGEFIENEREMNDAELKQLRRLSRELDSDENPYACIVSVLMLREGWDVKNVTTIVPLRPFTANSQILPEQTLGRGLRRMTPPGADEVVERVVVIEHPAFEQLYQDALGIEGVTPIVTPVDSIRPTVVSIYPEAMENAEAPLSLQEETEGYGERSELDIAIPQVSQAYQQRITEILTLTRCDVEKQFEGKQRLSLSGETESTIAYEGYHLLTREKVEEMNFGIQLLGNGWTAISHFVKKLEAACGVPRMLHPVLAPLLAHFLTEMLFEEPVSLTDERLIRRLKDNDVAAAIESVFKPLILEKAIHEETRQPLEKPPMRLSEWMPYPFTQSQRHPAVMAEKTLFNLVPCHSHFEADFARWLDAASDVVAFAKNAGPQALRIDYLNASGRIARYIPDFFVRDNKGAYFLIETKGMPDANAEHKARAARAWCRAASQSGASWTYLFVPQAEARFRLGQSLSTLLRTDAAQTP